MNPDDWNDLTNWLALASRVYPSEKARIDEVVKKIARMSAREQTDAALASLAAPVQRVGA